MSAEYSRKPFVSHDASDENGVRAEVSVTVGVGKVNEIVVGGKGVTAQAKFSVEGLKYSINGWCPVNDPIYQIISDAKESGELVEFRVEHQRKATIDRTTPISELRSSAEAAKENTTSILAGARKVSDKEMTFSSEAVTNPAEDPLDGTGGRRSALHDPTTAAAPTTGASTPAVVLDASVLTAATKAGLPQEVITALAGNLLAGGVPADAVATALYGEHQPVNDSTARPVSNSRVAAREETPWKSHNTDGRLNLGSANVAAAVGFENFVRRHVLLDKELIPAVAHDEDLTNVLIAHLTSRLLQVADYTQRMAYGGGFIPDRSVNSHNRIRGIMYDVIDHYLPITKEVLEDNTARNNWLRNVHEVTLKRFRVAITATENNTLNDDLILSALYPESKSGGETPSNESEKQQAQQATKADNADKHQGDEQPTAAPIPDYVFKPSAGNDKEVLATDETVALLTELASEHELTNEEKIGLGTLLEKTLGARKAINNSEADLSEFVDFYVARDGDDLRAAIAWAVSQ